MYLVMTEFTHAELTLCGLQYVTIQLLSDFFQRGQSVFSCDNNFCSAALISFSNLDSV